MNARDLRSAGVALARQTLQGWAAGLQARARLLMQRAADPPAVAPEVAEPSPEAGPSQAQAPAHWLERVRRGPPAHWLERVQRDAPQLLEPGQVPLVTVPRRPKTVGSNGTGTRRQPVRVARPLIAEPPQRSRPAPAKLEETARGQTVTRRRTVLSPATRKRARVDTPVARSVVFKRERRDVHRAPAAGLPSGRVAEVVRTKPKPARKRPAGVMAPVRRRRAPVEARASRSRRSPRAPAAIAPLAVRPTKRVIEPPVFRNARQPEPMISLPSRQAGGARHVERDQSVVRTAERKREMSLEFEHRAPHQHAVELPTSKVSIAQAAARQLSSPTVATRPQRPPRQVDAPANGVTNSWAPDDPWPKLLPSHEMPIEDAAAALRTWSHLQRLDREQRGMSWSA